MAQDPLPHAGHLAKLSRPNSKNVLLRERLLTLLDQTLGPSSVWISGPAGMGKTTLASSYLESRKRNHIWFRFDEVDADPATFFYYFRIAAVTHSSGLGKTLPLLTPEYLAGLTTFARKFFRTLFASVKAPFLIVLDDFQDFPEESAMARIVRIGMEEAPDDCALLVLSREYPPDGLATLLVRGTLVHIDRTQLALSLEESAGLAQILGKDSLSEDVLRTIHERSHGWVAGAMLMQRNASISAGGRTTGTPLSNGTLFDFFAGEVLASTDPEVREFLLRIGFLPEMSVEMAEQVSGNPSAGKLLSRLYRKNLFLERHGHPKSVYQIHSLFANFLKHHAENEYDQRQLRAVKRDAANVLEKAGRLDSALALLAEISDWEHFIAIVTDQAPLLMQQGRFKLLQQWIGRLPKHVAENDPSLSYWVGIATLPEDPAGARAHLVRAYSLYEAAGETAGCLMAWPAIVDTIMYEWGDFHPLDQWIDSLTALLKESSRFPSAQVEAQVVTGMFNALMFRQPDNPDLPVWERRMEELVENSADPNLRIIIGSRLAQYGSMTGTFSKARQILDRLRPLTASDGVSPLTRITFHSVEAIYHWITGQPDACLESVSKGLRISSETGVAVSDFFLYSQGGYGALTKGDTQSAEEFLAQMETRLSPDRYLDQSLFHYLSSWSECSQGDLSRAREEIGIALQHSLRSGMRFSEAVDRVAAAQAAVQAGNRSEAKSHLKKARDIAQAMRSDHIRYMCLVVTAHSSFSAGDTRAGEEALRAAFALGREHGYWNFPWWQPSMMSPLAGYALRHRIEVDYVRALIRARGLVPSLSDGPLQSWPWPVRIRTFGGMVLELDEKPVEFARKAKKKPLELLKAIISLDSGSGISLERIADMLWPDSEGDAAEKAFAINLHRLRELLRNGRAIRRIEGALSLNPELCWVDSKAFEASIEAALQSKAQGDQEGYRQSLELAVSWYSGPFLPNDESLPWTVPIRERLRAKFIEATCELAELLGQIDAQGAIHFYQNGIAVEPLQEGLYYGLIRHHLRRGAQSEALAIYDRCRETFASENLPLSPSGPLETLFQEFSASHRK